MNQKPSSNRRLLSLAIAALVVVILATPLMAAMEELTYLAYPSHTHTPGSSFASLFASRVDRLETGIFLLTVLAVVLLQELAVARYPLSERNPFPALAAIPVLSVVAGIGLNIPHFYLDSPLPLVQYILKPLYIALWVGPWLAVAYAMRSMMAVCGAGEGRWTLYVTGIALGVLVTLALSRWFGEGDGVGQILVALSAYVGLTTMIAGGFAALVIQLGTRRSSQA